MPAKDRVSSRKALSKPSTWKPLFEKYRPPIFKAVKYQLKGPFGSYCNGAIEPARVEAVPLTLTEAVEVLGSQTIFVRPVMIGPLPVIGVVNPIPSATW